MLFGSLKKTPASTSPVFPPAIGLDAIGQLAFDRNAPLRHQIARAMRDLIRRGVLTENMKLPPSKQLAQVWRTTEFTVNRGLKPLIQEGLLDSKRRLGTVVRRLPESRDIAIYMPDELFCRPTDYFFVTLYAQLRRILEARGFRGRLWADSRPSDERSTAPRDLALEIELRHIVGLIVPNLLREHAIWIGKLHVPAVGLSAVPGYRSIVQFDQHQLFSHFFDRIIERGKHNVGFILPFPRETAPDPDSRGEIFFQSLDRSLAQRPQIQCRPEWLRARHAGVDHASYGFRSFMEIWNAHERPDAVIVYPDTVGRGVLQAIWKLGIRVPDELILCLHRNEGFPLECPFPVLWAETSVSSVAQVLIDSLQSKIDGRLSPVSITLPFRFYEEPTFPREDAQGNPSKAASTAK
jgi:DNA-binding LacI/PurR family transcriptional regulator